MYCVYAEHRHGTFELCCRCNTRREADEMARRYAKNGASMYGAFVRVFVEKEG